MGRCCTKEKICRDGSQSQELQNLIELVNKASIRFEPRSLIDLAGQVATSRWMELNRLPIQVKRCLFSEIYIKHVAWTRDSLDQQLIIEVSSALRKILIKSNGKSLPLNFDRIKLKEKARLLKVVHYLIDNFDQFAHRCRYEAIRTWVEIDPVPTQDLGFAIEQTQRWSSDVMKLLTKWSEHWKALKSIKPDKLKGFLLEVELGTV